MSSSRRFSEISTAYNTHVANLDKARHVFEQEVEALNDFVFKHLEDRRTWPVEGIRKIRWGKPEPWSSAREVAWLNWVAASRIRMDVKPPGYMNFKKAAAYVFFQTNYDDDLSRFVFTCRLENQNTVDTDLDEEAIAVVRTLDPAHFPNAKHVKRNRALLFRCELGDSLFDEVNEWVDRGLDVVTKTIDRMFPDSRYTASVGLTDDPED